MSFLFCTISTQSHLYKAYALADSLSKYNGHLAILVIDGKGNSAAPSNVSFYHLDNLESPLAQEIIIKYKGEKDKMRWSLKPIFLTFLLQNREKVIYIDNDIFFFNDFRFLYQALDDSDILLTPHNYARNPSQNQNWLEANFKVGLYNAGFFACNSKAKEVLDWWARCCLYRCEKSNMRGLFDDQKYLDLVPIIHPNTKVLQHRGCNVAEWNEYICKRELVDGAVLVNGKYPIVFYHFNGFSVRQILKERTNLMSNFLSQYVRVLKKYKSTIKAEDLQNKESLMEKIKLKVWQTINRIN